MVLANDLSQEEVEAALKEAMNVVAAPAEARPRRRRVVRRRPGAPLGNRNALKHGLYAKSLTPEELALLPRARAISGLDEEVAVMRLKIAELLADHDGRFNLLLRSFGRLTQMVRANHMMRNGR
ncbi:MAG: hypothetical protein OXN15_08795 [Chloroflexota bacterium]|nr:hypothetical protein [Chloroflexota bacterium]MDE2970454.1 hypothetical protein [Chloroflexota bacterium]